MGATATRSFDQLAHASAKHGEPDYEAAPSERLLAYPRGRDDVAILGHASSDRAMRAPTISFVIGTRRSRDVVEPVDPSGIGIRFGGFYSRRLEQVPEPGDPDGVIQVSAAHCDTLDEMDPLIERFESLRRQAA